VPALETLPATRIVAAPTALDSARWPDGSLPLRTAPDEVLLVHTASVSIGSSAPHPLPTSIGSSAPHPLPTSIGSSAPHPLPTSIGSSAPHPLPTSIGSSAPHPLTTDPHAIIAPEGSFMGMWLPLAEALEYLERACAWELPTARPAFAQGAVANIPLKLWFEHDRVLFIVQSPFAADFEERMKW
jgi:hypothetical protein